ncbi:MAG: iron ABC transporter permease [Bacteroidales bacterium]|nr:iron ABC transporter permease [Bacteroidales bacterium]
MQRALPAIILVFTLALDLLVGGGGVSVATGAVLWKLRVPRVLTAVIAGGALAASGAQMQAVFRNPLADPHIMGVSGGAGLGAAIATMAVGVSASAFTGFTVAVAAFIGAIAAAFLVVLVSARFRSSTTLLVFGVMLGFIFSALSSVLQYTAGEESLKLFYSWMAGSFSGCRYLEIILMAAALAAGLVLALVNGKGLDLILFGDEYAALSGASTRRILVLSMLSCCLMTGTVTAFCGPLGFVGIVAPHIARRVTGSSAHRQVLPWSLLCGALLALAADILANLWPIPLPVGSTLALIGIPLILVLLLRQQHV